MKIIIVTHAIICISIFIFIPHASGQSFKSFPRLGIKLEKTVDNDRDSFLPINTSENFRNDINISAVRRFVKQFKDAKNVIWCKDKDVGFTAEFKNDSIKTMVGYNRNGSLNYYLYRYSENLMPDAIKYIIKSSFPGYLIMEVTEIKRSRDDENVVYCVLINYQINYKVVQICNSETKVTSDFSNN